MQSCSDDLEEAFQYLSREMLEPDVIAAEPQQQVPTPPVSFGLPPRSPATALTLL